MKGIEKLMQAEESEKKRTLMGNDGAVREVVSWAKLNYLRSLMPIIGSTLAAYAAFTD
jgi:hypothetical protein